MPRSTRCDCPIRVIGIDEHLQIWSDRDAIGPFSLALTPAPARILISSRVLIKNSGLPGEKAIFDVFIMSYRLRKLLSPTGFFLNHDCEGISLPFSSITDCRYANSCSKQPQTRRSCCLGGLDLQGTASVPHSVLPTGSFHGPLIPATYIYVLGCRRKQNFGIKPSVCRVPAWYLSHLISIEAYPECPVAVAVNCGRTIPGVVGLYCVV